MSTRTKTRASHLTDGSPIATELNSREMYLFTHTIHITNCESCINNSHTCPKYLIHPRAWAKGPFPTVVANMDTLHRDSYPLKSGRPIKYPRHVETKLAKFVLACGGTIETHCSRIENIETVLKRSSEGREKQRQIQEDRHIYSRSIIY